MAEQNGFVAAATQFANITTPALPPSNQIDAQLFDEGRNDSNGESS
jgi:hypothetical protein